MKITRNQVEHIAHLARLEFNENELNAFTQQLNDILTYFDRLKEVNTISVKPTSHAIEIKNVFREDEVKNSLDLNLTLKNAPGKEDNFFQVPKVIE
ncbi:MAG: Asp-tRNA(Asn)/Glu-tRNA(Gln) amidotransferase subunit GatC [Desulfobacterota bacterium]|nr:Asp-tRNA(Asn)/Glu-tRNA(Gln) amidotransferase subunit GatC [Thermodesulfobacteriota bacterium]